MFGITAVQFGFPWADPAAALGVVVFIVFAALRMGREAVAVLLDQAPAETENDIRRALSVFPDIRQIRRLRVRSDGRYTFADVQLDVDRSLSFARAASLKEEIHDHLVSQVPRVDVTFTFKPVSSDSEHIADTVRYVVDSFNLTAHHLIVKKGLDGYLVSMHIEMSGNKSLDEAHDITTEIAAQIRRTSSTVKKIVIHPEPYKGEQIETVGDIKNHDELSVKVRQICESFPGVDDCHNISISPHQDGLALSADIRLDGRRPLAESHRISHDVEERLRHELPNLISITLHLEPWE